MEERSMSRTPRRKPISFSSVVQQGYALTGVVLKKHELLNPLLKARRFSCLYRCFFLALLKIPFFGDMFPHQHLKCLKGSYLCELHRVFWDKNMFLRYIFIYFSELGTLSSENTTFFLSNTLSTSQMNHRTECIGLTVSKLNLFKRTLSSPYDL